MDSKRTAGREPDDSHHILIRHLTTSEVDRLKKRAEQNLRTMSAEATIILREALQ